VHAASPSFPTVGGSVGVTYTYNSGAPAPYGITGAYYNGCEGPSPLIPSQPVMVRRDPAVQFNWTSSSPAPGVVDVDNYCVEWTGSIIVPSTQSFCFNAVRDDGVRIWVNNTTLVDSWTDQAVGTPPWTTTGTDCISLTAGVVYPVKVDYYQHDSNATVGLWVKGTGINPMPVPSSWFTAVDEALPTGWSLSAGDRELSYASAKVSSSSVTLVEPSGATHEYRKVGAGGLGWTPQAGEDAVMTSGTENGQPVYVVADTDGLVYTFDAQGKLLRAVSSTDDVNAAAATYAYGGNGQVSSITDPVSGGQITLVYSATTGTNPCGTPPSGYSVAPNGMLCQVTYWDGTSTVLMYNANGQLTRIVDPGGTTTDFAYDSAGRVSAVRDPLQYDAVVASRAPDDDTSRTLISYNSTGRASQVTLALPTSGPQRPNHSYRYVSGTETQLDVAGLSEPNGYAQRVVYDGAGRLTTQYDTAGLATTKEWDTNDRVTASNDPAGRRSTSVYDTAGRPTDSYGPAPASCFTGQVPNTSCTGSAAPPHSTTGYDEGVAGLAAAYWPNQSLAGAATSHATGVGDATGALNHSWGTSPPAALSSGSNWSARYTGDITFPSSGTYTLKVGAGDDQGVRAFVDDKPVIDTWGARSAPAVSSWGANRLDLFARGTGNAIMHKYWNGTAWSSTWENLGGSWTSDAAAVSWGSNRIDLFARGQDNALWHKLWDGSWHDWESLGGTLTSAPAVSSWGTNRLDVFVRSTGNAVYQKTFNGSWGGWVSIGGNVASEPAATSWGSNRIDVFARGNDNTLQHASFNGAWSAWESLGGSMASAPDVASWGANRLDAFYRGTDDTLSHKYFNGSWHTPESLGGALSTAPGVAATPGTTRLDVLAQGTDTTLRN
jgi:YD repeat-containing protein